MVLALVVFGSTAPSTAAGMVSGFDGSDASDGSYHCWLLPHCSLYSSRKVGRFLVALTTTVSGSTAPSAEE